MAVGYRGSCQGDSGGPVWVLAKDVSKSKSALFVLSFILSKAFTNLSFSHFRNPVGKGPLWLAQHRLDFCLVRTGKM